jgi:hypothetical protein
MINTALMRRDNEALLSYIDRARQGNYVLHEALREVVRNVHFFSTSRTHNLADLPHDLVSYALEDTSVTRPRGVSEFDNHTRDIAITAITAWGLEEWYPMALRRHPETGVGPCVSLFVSRGLAQSTRHRINLSEWRVADIYEENRDVFTLHQATLARLRLFGSSAKTQLVKRHQTQR